MVLLHLDVQKYDVVPVCPHWLMNEMHAIILSSDSLHLG